MKKITTSLFFLITILFSANSQVQIGYGNTVSPYVPFTSSNPYSYSQSIYLASDINTSGTITSLQWYYTGTSAMPNSQQLVVYLGTTSKSAFASKTDWVTLPNLTQVYTGGITTNSAPGWVTITLATPFVYDGISNLVVAVNETKPGFDFSSDKFNATSVTGQRSIIYYGSSVVNPASPSLAIGPLTLSPNVIFGGITQTCGTPAYLTTSSIGTTTASVSWASTTDKPSGGSDYYVSTSDVPTSESTAPTGNVPNGTSVNLTGLNPATTYYVWVRNNCGSGLYSNWSDSLSFVTACIQVTEFNENFDSIVIPKPTNGPRQTEELPYCWSKIVRANDGVVQPGTSVFINQDIVVMPSNSVNCCVLKNNNSTGNFDLILVSPPVSTLQLKNHRLKFFTKFGGTIEIGTLNSNTNTGTFTLFKTVETYPGFAEHVVDFSSYTGTDTYIGFRLPNNNGLYNGFSMDNITWEPLPLCPEISDIVVPQTTTSTAQVNWSPSVKGTESSWDVVVGDISVTDPNTLTPQNVSASLPATSVVGGLQSGTFYKVWVRAVCGGINGNGTWIGPVVFTTECEPVAAFYETFDGLIIPYTNLPPCWSIFLKGGQYLSIYSYITTDHTSVSLFPNFTAPNYVQINTQESTSEADVILVSPNVSTLGQSYRLKFDSYYPGTLQIGVLDGNTNASNFYLVKTVTLNGFGGRTIIDFSDYSGPINDFNHIGIKLVSGNWDSVDFDNITWEPVPACPDFTTKIKISLASPTTALVKWDKTGAEDSWQVSIHPTNPDAADAIHRDVSMMDSPSVLVDGLTPNTTYYVWVRTVCGAKGNGAWSVPIKFVTACLAVNVPYGEDFQSGILPPACTDTTVADNFTDGSTWETSNTTGAYGFPTANIRCFPSGSATNAWFFTSGVNLTAGTGYRISYLKGTSATKTGVCTGYCGPLNLRVMYGSSPTIDGMSNTLKEYVGLTGPASSDYKDFTVPTSGVYYFAFQNFSDAGAGDLFIDDILVDVSLGNDNFDLSQFNYYPNPVKNVLNISHNKDITSVAVYNVLGQKVLYKSVNAANATIDMSSLSSGTYLLKLTSDNQVRTLKIVKE